jgi:hypothetical protein
MVGAELRRRRRRGGSGRARQRARIEDDRALAIDDRHPQLDARLLDAVDVGDEVARVDGAKERRQRVDVQRAVGRSVLDQRRHQLRGLDERVLGRLAVARVDVAELANHQERDAERVGDEDADEDAGALGHRAPVAACADPVSDRVSLGKGSAGRALDARRDRACCRGWLRGRGRREREQERGGPGDFPRRHRTLLLPGHAGLAGKSSASA